MIATPRPSSENPLPRLGTQSAEAPEFQVQFSRPADFAGRPESRPNSFRWSRSGTIHVMERGLLIIAKRRSAIAFHTTQERFVPAAEIWDVYREGNSVRVDLRGELHQRDYFQFWTADAATAGTIVRLLPTTRTIEYEGTPAVPDERSSTVAAPKTPSSYLRRAPTRTIILLGVVAGLIGVASLIMVNKLLQPPHTDEHKLTAPAMEPHESSPPSTVASYPATQWEIEVARADLRRFDERIDGLRAQYRMAFAALQSGSLSQQGFVEGLDRWLLPQWRTLYGELASSTTANGPVDLLVRKYLMHSARGWERALDDYVKGLNEQNSTVVLEAFDRMSDANRAQVEAWKVIEDAER